MAKTQKAKSNKGTRNDNRSSGKAAKQNPGKKLGGRSTTVDPIALIIMGKGVYKQVENRARDEKLKSKADNRKKKS